MTDTPAIRLAHVCIETADLASTEHFYALLGIRRQFEFRNQQQELVGMYLRVSADSFIEVIKVASPRPVGLLRHFALQVEDVDGIYRTLVEAGVAVTEKEYAGDRNYMITCHDPNGVFIELQQYTSSSMQRVGGVCEVDYQP